MCGIGKRGTFQSKEAPRLRGIFLPGWGASLCVQPAILFSAVWVVLWDAKFDQHTFGCVVRRSSPKTVGHLSDRSKVPHPRAAHAGDT